MATIDLEQQDEKSWHVVVEDEDGTVSEHDITVDPGYYKRLTNKSITVEDFIEASFNFLLERETKETILLAFDLSDIQKYYSEYEEEMKKSYTSVS